MEPLQPIHVRGYVRPLGRRLARCIASSCSQIVERVLYLWNSPAFTSLFIRDKQNVSVLAPLVYSALRHCSEDTSNVSLRQMAIHVIGIMMDSNAELVEQLAEKYVAASQ